MLLNQPLSCVQLLPTPWTVAHQAPLSMGNSPGKNTGVGCHFFILGIFPIQGPNLSLLRCRQILYHWAIRDAPPHSKGVPYLFKHLPVIGIQFNFQIFAPKKKKREAPIKRLWKWNCSFVSDSWWPMDYRLPGFSVYGILQARVLKWVAFSFSRGSSHPRDWSRVSCIIGRCFTIWATREVLSNHKAIVLGAPNFSLFIPFFRDSSAYSSRFLICFSVLSVYPLFHFN